MGNYTQLTCEQRYQISGLRAAGWNQTQIAVEVGVDKSTISRELSRNQGQRGWRPKQAQSLRDERRLTCINGKKFSLHDWVEVGRLTQQDFSPEQVAYRLELEGGLQISHETIYQYIYADKRRGGVFYQPSGMAITNDLPSVFCWVSQMASSLISSFIRNRAANVMQADRNGVA